MAALVALAVLAACVAVNLPFLATYAVRGDTAALMLHSTRFFPADAGEWVREGFARYFVNYPEATRPYTGFVRPVVNASIWIESLLAAGPNSPVFLLTNYLGHAACSGLVYLAARRLGALGRRQAIVAAALFAGTVAAVELLRSPAFRADMLAAGFSLAALLLADGWLRGGRWTKIALAAVLLVLAIFSKETAVTAPFLCAAWVAALAPSSRPRRDRLVAAAALLVPLGAFALARAAGPQGAYVSLAGVKGNLAQVASSAFFPGGGVFELLAILRGAPMDAASVRALVAFALNLAGAALVVRALLRRDRPAAMLVLAAAAAFAIPALLAPAARMLYFGQMFALPLFIRALPERRGAARAIVGLGLMIGPAWLLGSMATAQPEQVAANRDSARLQRVLAAELRDPRIRRVYLVGDVVGDYGALALVRAAALRAGRADVAPRVTSSMGRFGDDEARRGTMELRREGSDLVVDQRCAETCDFSFPGVAPGDEKQLGERGIITYREVQPRQLVFAIPAATCDYLLVGFTPARDGVHVLRPCGTAWFRAPGSD